MTPAQPPEAGYRRRALVLLVWIVTIALFVVLLGAAIVLSAELSFWAFTSRGHVTTAPPHHRAAAVAAGKDPICILAPHD